MVEYLKKPQIFKFLSLNENVCKTVRNWRNYDSAQLFVIDLVAIVSKVSNRFFTDLRHIQLFRKRLLAFYYRMLLFQILISKNGTHLSTSQLGNVYYRTIPKLTFLYFFSQVQKRPINFSTKKKRQILEADRLNAPLERAHT